MLRIAVHLDPLTSLAAFDELCDVVMREYPDARWLIDLAHWDVEARTCLVAAPTSEEVLAAFTGWCADMGLPAPRLESRPLTAQELARLRREQGEEVDDEDDD
jgi:hypothetical protein